MSWGANKNFYGQTRRRLSPRWNPVDNRARPCPKVWCGTGNPRMARSRLQTLCDVPRDDLREGAFLFLVRPHVQNPCLYLDGVRVAEGRPDPFVDRDGFQAVDFFECDELLPLDLAPATRVAIGYDDMEGGPDEPVEVRVFGARGLDVDVAGFERGKRLTDARGWRTTLWLDRPAGRLVPAAVRDWFIGGSVAGDAARSAA